MDELQESVSSQRNWYQSYVQLLHGWCLTIHSSRRRFAARLNSGVRPHVSNPRYRTCQAAVDRSGGLGDRSVRWRASVSEEHRHLSAGSSGGFGFLAATAYDHCLLLPLVLLGLVPWSRCSRRAFAQARLLLAACSGGN